MQALLQIAKNVQKIDYGFLMKQLFLDPYFKATIVDLNTKGQLFEKGVDADGIKLKSHFARFGQVYANKTIAIKEIKGQPTDRVTLKDEGTFYSSFKLVYEKGAFFIDAKTLKKDNDLQEVWGQDILGLTDESLQEIINLAIEIIIPVIEKKILE